MRLFAPTPELLARSLARAHRATTLCLFASLSACGPAGIGQAQDAAVDVEPDATPVPTSRTLQFLPGDDLALEPGAVAPLRVRLSSADGTTVPGDEVRFALVGEAADATIDVTRALTARRTAPATGGGVGDEEGVAVVRLTAPMRGPAMFRVRASAAGAPEAYRSVSVSSQGFGSLAISVRYAGTRGPDHLALSLYAGATCSMLDRLEPLRAVRVAPAGATVTFGALAAGVSLAVRGEAVGAAGEVLARGCVDTLEVRRDEATAATLPLEDLPLRVQGAYTLSASLDLGALTEPAARAWTTAVQAAAPEGDERLLLTAVAVAVESRAGFAARSRFEGYWGLLLPAVQADVARRNASPTRALTRLAQDTAVVLRGANLVVTLGGDAAGGSAMLAIRSAAVRLDPITPDVERDDVTLSVPAGGTGMATSLFGDRLRVRLAGVPFPFSAAARRASDALLARRGVSSPAEWASLNARCRDFAFLVYPYAPACDETCVIAACESAVASLAAVLVRSTETFGAEHTRVELEFETTARGRTGSLRIESAEPAPLAGFFEGDAEAIFVGVALLGSL